jgi:hypothetical protein
LNETAAVIIGVAQLNMPALIEHTDAIACTKQRAVLYHEFHPRPFSEWRKYEPSFREHWAEDL